jgi:LPXTG-motif cell wall-anchored protein
LRAVRRSVSVAASLLLLALPAVAPAQTPGDEQYTDPFGGEQEEGGGSQPDQQEPEEPAPTEPAPAEPETSTPSQEPAAPAPEPAAAPAAEQLPRTGADAGVIALGGTLLLAGGVALRVRVSERSPRRP